MIDLGSVPAVIMCARMPEATHVGMAGHVRCGTRQPSTCGSAPPTSQEAQVCAVTVSRRLIDVAHGDGALDESRR